MAKKSQDNSVRGELEGSPCPISGSRIRYSHEVREVLARDDTIRPVK